MSDALMEDIVSMRPDYIAAEEGLARNLQSSWVWWQRYGAELLTFVRNLNIVFRPKPKKSRTKAPQATTGPLQVAAPAPAPAPRADPVASRVDASGTTASSIADAPRGEKRQLPPSTPYPPGQTSSPKRRRTMTIVPPMASQPQTSTMPGSSLAPAHMYGDQPPMAAAQRQREQAIGVQQPEAYRVPVTPVRAFHPGQPSMQIGGAHV